MHHGSVDLDFLIEHQDTVGAMEMMMMEEEEEEEEEEEICQEQQESEETWKTEAMEQS